jgi:antitoxin component YwqK of YwqJK toxin-antitoxin module
VNDKVHGIVKEYYASGALERETSYKNGKKHGKKKEYCEETGALKKVTLYEDGESMGIVTKNNKIWRY